MTEEERKWMEYWQRRQADENARAFWRSINEPWMPVITFIVVLGGIWLVVANVWIYRLEILSWLGNHLTIEGALAVLILGVFLTHLSNKAKRQRGWGYKFLARCNEDPYNLPPGWQEILKDWGYEQDRSGQWVKHV